MPRLTPHQALIYTMIATAAVDRELADKELMRIGSIVKELPPFSDYDSRQLVEEAQSCAAFLQKSDGPGRVVEFIRDALPQHLYETAYVFAAEVAATDLKVAPEEVRFLEMLAEKFGLDKLTTAALERAAKARHQKV